MAVSQAVAADGGNVGMPDGVATRVTDAGTYYVTAEGMALYTYLRDSEPGVSTCVEACAEEWPPLAASADTPPHGPWQVISRPEDNGHQWAFRGHPVYLFAKDDYAGGMFGDNIGGAWRVLFEPIKTPPGIVVSDNVLGRVLTDTNGMTIYAMAEAQQAGNGCTGPCLDAWRPVRAPVLANDFGEWTAVKRGDGIRQWAFRGQPLFTSAIDVRPGDALGSGGDLGWAPVVLDPPLPLPAWVTVQSTDLGQVYADADGMTLYTFFGDLKKSQAVTCDADCTAKYWRPVAADAAATPIGDWSPVETEHGRQWAYKGDPVYTHTRDTEPGAVGGDEWATGAAFGGRWSPVMRPLGTGTAL